VGAAKKAGAANLYLYQTNCSGAPHGARAILLDGRRLDLSIGFLGARSFSRPQLVPVVWLGNLSCWDGFPGLHQSPIWLFRAAGNRALDHTKGTLPGGKAGGHHRELEASTEANASPVAAPASASRGPPSQERKEALGAKLSHPSIAAGTADRLGDSGRA